MSPMMVQRTALVASLIALGVMVNFAYSVGSGASLEQSQTVAMTTMVFFQFFQAWNSRSETVSLFGFEALGNQFLAFSLMAAFFAQLAVIYVPALQWVFRTQPPSLVEWVMILGMSVTVIFVVEMDKYVRSRGWVGAR